MKTILLKDAAALIPDGATVMIGGFMGVGTPERLVDELVRQGKRNLTVIANDNAMPGIGIGKLIRAGAVKKTIASHIGLNPETQKKMLAGELEVELVPQGTLIERIRAGGFGLGGVLTPTGVGTVVAEGKETFLAIESSGDGVDWIELRDLERSEQGVGVPVVGGHGVVARHRRDAAAGFDPGREGGRL
jgi:3-oxoacid CoA-transferase A subunit